MGPILIGGIVAKSEGWNCGVVRDGGGNFDDDGSCGDGFRRITGLDPVLADNGGPTPTHALLPGSSALDAAGGCGLATDQRGFFRDAACDSGAFEFGAREPLGGAVSGLESAKQVTCDNRSSGERVAFTLEGPNAWSCEAEGLPAADPGETVQMTVRGTVAGAGDPVAGEVTGMGLTGVTCRNETTGEVVRAVLAGETMWDCVALGLEVSPGDRLRQSLLGVAD